MSSLPVTYKSTPRVVSLVPEILWSAGALFASSLALMVSGAVVLLMMCLFRLADLSQKWDGDVISQSLLLRERTAGTSHRELWSDPDEDMPRLSDTFVLSLNEQFLAAAVGTFARAHRPEAAAGKARPCQLTPMEGAACRRVSLDCIGLIIPCGEVHPGMFRRVPTRKEFEQTAARGRLHNEPNAVTPTDSELDQAQSPVDPGNLCGEDNIAHHAEFVDFGKLSP